MSRVGTGPGSSHGADRDLDELGRRMAGWLSSHRRDAGRPLVTSVTAASSGYSNDTLLVDVSWTGGTSPVDERLVLRLPPVGPGLFPTYDLGMQLRVQELAADHLVPVPPSLAFEDDAHWLGAPFLVMAHVEGHIPREVAARDPWITGAPLERQRDLYEGFLTTLAALHRVEGDHAGLAAVVRGAGGRLGDELAWWADYLAWACGDEPVPLLADALRWCQDNQPSSEPAHTLLWGDVRLGNVVFGDDVAVKAVLDWEMASIGPPETDLGWFLALEAAQASLLRATVPGFPDRAEAVAFYEAQLGRQVTDLAWHEIFALVRSAAVMVRQARLVEATGAAAPWPITDNPILRVITRRIDRAEAVGRSPRGS